MSALKTVQKTDKLLSDFSSHRSNLIPILQSVQEKLGYLPRESIERISEYTKVAEAKIYGIATFYAQFRFTPVGKNRITVCQGTACHVRGGAQILREMETGIGIKSGETSNDLQFTLETVGCVGSCALAPVVVVNDKVNGAVTPTKAREIMGELSGEKKAPETQPEAEEKETRKPEAKKSAKQDKQKKSSTTSGKKQSAKKSTSSPTKSKKAKSSSSGKKSSSTSGKKTSSKSKSQGKKK